MDFHIGQEVWFVRHSWGRPPGPPESWIIAKIGRKWIGTKRPDQRFDKTSMIADGFGMSSPGKVWLTLEDYEKSVAANAAWLELLKRMQYADRPYKVSSEDIAQAAALLFPTTEPQQ